MAVIINDLELDLEQPPPAGQPAETVPSPAPDGEAPGPRLAPQDLDDAESHRRSRRARLAAH